MAPSEPIGPIAKPRSNSNNLSKRAPAAIVHVPTASTKGRSYSSTVSADKSSSYAFEAITTSMTPANASESSPSSRGSLLTSSKQSSDSSAAASSSEAGSSNNNGSSHFVPRRNGSGAKAVDASKPLHKNTPAPCNRFYLTDAGCLGTCNFSHEYKLTPLQLSTVSKLDSHTARP